MTGESSNAGRLQIWNILDQDHSSNPVVGIGYGNLFCFKLLRRRF